MIQISTMVNIEIENTKRFFPFETPIFAFLKMTALGSAQLITTLFHRFSFKNRHKVECHPPSEVLSPVIQIEFINP